MPRPRIHSHWIESIYRWKGSHEVSSSAQIRLALEREWDTIDEMKKVVVGPPPKAKTIRTYVARFDDEPLEVKRSYVLVSWPSSFARGDLPWDVVPAFLDLLRWNHQLSPPRSDSGLPADSPEWLEYEQAMSDRRRDLVKQGIKNRPTVRLVRWLHNITQAAPNSPFDWRLEMASHLAAAEGAGASELAETVNRNVEAQIAAEFYHSMALQMPGPEKED